MLQLVRTRFDLLLVHTRNKKVRQVSKPKLRIRRPVKKIYNLSIV
jgi:hypothetical protein